MPAESEMTIANLQDAFSGESQAHMRYRIYGERAEMEGYPNVARLFRAISYAEEVHASNHFSRLPLEEGPATAAAPFGLGDTVHNLEQGIAGESFEINEMYPAYKEVAAFQEEKAAGTSFDWALQAEKNHLDFYQRAKESVEAGQDLALDEVRICSVCGHTLEGEAPEECPICGAKREEFREFA